MVVGIAPVVLWLVSGWRNRLTIDTGVALTAGLRALVIAASLYEGHLVPVDRRCTQLELGNKREGQT